ncbi:UNVERIFIED_CONTAM: hypothetical protein PYX00_006541 [Menopon gallinae]|uniref:Uncharacterized protein n=1 Tax=Menopon gallinae TaxID=328185 RepID=A0AAW2HVP7_9NEOP
MLPGAWERRFSDLERDVKKYFKILIFLSLLCSVFIYRYSFLTKADQMESVAFYRGLREDINDPGQLCQLPSYHPFERDVLHHFRTPRPISCRSTIPVLTFIDEHGFLRYNRSAFEESGYLIDGLKCYYQEITRMESSDEKISYGEEMPMTGEDKPRTDFVFVYCRKYLWLPNVYSMYHAFAQKKDTARTFRDEAEVGVAVVGFDSVSRLNFMRQLPQSYHYITNNMNGVVLKGFNKVGENTFPNLIAMLTGNMPRAEWSRPTFDDWPFLWNALNADGVATFYGEDCPSIMTFTWQGEGFLSDPTTHYFRPFWLAAESSSLAAWSSPMCLGPVPKHKIYLNYLKSFLTSYRNHPVFMFSLENEPSHDYLNTVGVSIFLREFHVTKTGILLPRTEY